MLKTLVYLPCSNVSLGCLYTKKKRFKILNEERSLRIPAFFRAKLISGGKSYEGITGNLSESGALLETVPTKTVTDFIPGKRLELDLQIPSGETLNLHCKIVWLYTEITRSHDLENKMGIKIVDPPSKYKEFLKTL
jgi:hypothetical protein